jgi:hypothetical protein
MAAGDPDVAQRLTDWLAQNAVEVLNVADPRASKEPGIANFVRYRPGRMRIEMLVPPGHSETEKGVQAMNLDWEVQTPAFPHARIQHAFEPEDVQKVKSSRAARFSDGHLAQNGQIH